MLRHGVVCCSVLQCGAKRDVECDAAHDSPFDHDASVSRVICRVLQSVAECCRVLQSVAECCSVLQRGAKSDLNCGADHDNSCDSCQMQCAVVWCSALQCIAMCSSVLQCVAVHCSVLQCIAECCSVL